MACFLGCFGFAKKRKRPKSATTRILFGDQVHGSYEPLDRRHDLTIDTSQKNPIPSHSIFRDEHKDRLSSRIKKKVSFNLNVRTYEPLQKDEATYSFSDEEPEKATISTVESEDNLKRSTTGPFPSNHRYQSSRDSYDEYDDIELEESDIDDEFDDTDGDEEENNHESDYYDYGDDYDTNGPKTSGKDYLEPIYASKHELGKRVDCSKSDEGATGIFSSIHALRGEEVKKAESVRNVRDRSQYVHSVLNPVENLTQWKAVKARAAPKTKKQKENIVTKEEEWIPSDHSKPLIQGFAVDSSLSNWLNPSSTETISIVTLKKNEQL